MRRVLRHMAPVVAVVVCLAGCAPPVGPWVGKRDVRTRDVLDRAMARTDSVQTVRVSGRVSVNQGGARFDAKHSMFFERPARYRIDVESKPFLGLFEASLSALADGDSLVVYSPSYGFVLEASGADDLDLLGPELSWVAFPGVRSAMLGLADFAGSEPLDSTVREDRDGMFEVALASPEGMQTVWIDHETFHVTRMEIRSDSGGLLVGSEFDYASGESLFPKRVKVKCPESDAVILLTYSKFQVNGDIDPSVFRLNIPANVRRFRPDR